MKKEILKNVAKTSLILLLAVISTYFIYREFQGEGNVDISKESLEVIYHDSEGDKIKITKVTPVTDSVGLSSNSYTISIKNNLTMDVNYKIKIVDDEEVIETDECEDISIPKENIRISVKNGKSTNQIYTLDELEDEILLDETIEALKSEDIVIRVWVKRDSTLTPGAKMHYHGKIELIEEEVETKFEM